MNRLNDVIEYASTMTVLYVEDNASAREMTVLMLEEFFETVLQAADGQEGLEVFEQHAVDLVITDINMPRLDGLEMSRTIRKEDREVSIVILSAHSDNHFFMESIDIGVDGYLLKPVDVDQMIALLGRIVKKQRFTQESRAHMQFLQSHQSAASLSQIVSRTDPRGIITYVNDAFCAISGYRREELLGQPHNIVRHPGNPPEVFQQMWKTIRDEKAVWRGTVRNRTKEGKSYYVDSLILPVLDRDGEVIEYISHRNDITDIMQPIKQLTQALRQARDQILIYMKLDRFEMMEEFYDNASIERIQEKMAAYLQEVFATVFTFEKVFSLENGEFALLSNDQYWDKRVFMSEIQKLQDHLYEQTLSCEGFEFDTAVLMSVVWDGERILESARLGIKRLLADGKNLIEANHLAVREQDQARANMEMVKKLKDAILHSRVLSYFQPIVDNRTRKVIKYESLVRLIDGEGRLILPAEFLEVSKRCNYYSRITEHVLENSFALLKRTEADVSINLSALDIERRTTRERIYALLERHRDQAPRIIFELLEDEAVRDYDVIRDFIARIKSLGVKIAIDDFGAGYSNYERLLTYQPDILKIDGSLILNIATSPYSLSIVKSIVTFAREQDLEIVAEFIENETIFSIVRDLGIEFSQGYLFGRPEPMEKALERIR